MWLLTILACMGGREPALPARDAGPTLAARFGDWPFLTPIDAPTTVGLLDGGTLASDAATCGGCHVDTFREWSATTHASALRDLQYLAELQKPDSPRWLCLNCHVPTAPQRAVAIGPETRLADPIDIRAVLAAPNPTHTPGAEADGVTCATCHVRRDADGAGIVVGTGASAVGGAPHRVRVDPDGLRDVCVRCHSPGPAVVTPQFYCWFETADELARGPDAGKECVTCHMPTTERAVAVGSEPRTTRQHHWVGGGVPKSYDAYATLLARGFSPGLEVEVAVVAGAPTVSLRNVAGHALPTGDPERHLRVEARIEDAAGRVLAREVIRIGQRWDWGDAGTGRPARRVADERLGPGETRGWSPALGVPEGSVGVTLVVEVAHVRLSPANAEHMKATSLDAELTGYRPDAPARIEALDEHYPLATFIHRERVRLAYGTHEVTPLEALLAESAEAAGWTLAEKARRFSVE